MSLKFPLQESLILVTRGSPGEMNICDIRRRTELFLKNIKVQPAPKITIIKYINISYIS